MIEFGYALSSEEHGPNDLVDLARRAEEVGFTFALLSDHYHPWIDRQGHSPFAWSVLGGIAHATERLRLGTGVTCPMMRYHPAMLAQMAATIGAMMPGRFFLGVGTGENLNEHILGDRWPSAPERREMLEEAIAVLRLLWQGGEQSHRGRYYTVDHARIYDVPDPLPPIYVAASGELPRSLQPISATAWSRSGRARRSVKAYRAAGGTGPRYGQIHVCWAPTDAEARRVGREWWPNAAVPGELSQELPLPRHFEQATQDVTEDDVAKSLVCSADPEAHVAKLQELAQARLRPRLRGPGRARPGRLLPLLRAGGAAPAAAPA